LAHYGDSLSNALSDVYPTHKWIGWKFTFTPRGFWLEKENRAAFFKWFASETGLPSEGDLDRWYHVTLGDVKARGGMLTINERTMVVWACVDFVSRNLSTGTQLMRKYSNSMLNAMKDIFPDYDWKEWKFQVSQRASKNWEPQPAAPSVDNP
jgi:hypothetical protein